MTLFFYYNKSMEKQLTIIFDVDGTIADVEHRRHLVNVIKGLNPIGMHLDNFYCRRYSSRTCFDIAKRFIAKGDNVAFLVQETNQKEKLQNNKSTSGLVKVIKDCSLDLMVTIDLMKYSSLNLLTNSKN